MSPASKGDAFASEDNETHYPSIIALLEKQKEQLLSLIRMRILSATEDSPYKDLPLKYLQKALWA